VLLTVNSSVSALLKYGLQCFDAVGCVAGRALACKNLSGGMLPWLCVWVKVQICIWPS